MLNILNIHEGRGTRDIDGVTTTVKPGLIWNGKVCKVLAGEALSRGDIVYPVLTTSPAGEWKKANAAVGTAIAGMGYVLEGCADEGQALILLDGYIKNTDENYGTLASSTLTIGEPPTATDTISIGGQVFEFVAATADVAVATNIPVVFTNEADAKLAIVAAINAYSSYATAAAFSGDNALITSSVKGYAGNAIVLAETFTSVSNIWDSNDVLFSGGVEGGILYMGEGTGGALTLTAPSTASDVVQFMGYAYDAETFLFRPTVDYTVVSG